MPGVCPVWRLLDRVIPMMKKTFCLLSVLLVTPQVVAQVEQVGEDQLPEGYALLASGVPHDRLFATAFEGARGIAVGEVGQVMTTQDGGESWTRSQAPTDLALLGVDIEGNRQIAVGQMGLILTRESDGEWEEVESGTEERLLQVAMNSDGLAFAIGAFGTVLRSDDGGASWQDGAPQWTELLSDDAGGAGGTTGAAGEPHVYGIDVNDQGRVLLGGELSFIVRSEDAGQTWTVVNKGVATQGEIDPTFFDINVRDDGIGFAVGQSGAIFRTDNDGREWSRLESTTSDNLFGVESTDAGRVTVIGMRRALRSDNNGRTWQALTAGDLNTDWYSDISLVEGGGGPIIAGHSGRIMRLPE